MAHEIRIERDSMGDVMVPKDRMWGAQTQRSIENFEIGWEKMPISVIKAYAIIKTAAARVNCSLGLLSKEKSKDIEKACTQILDGRHDLEFPLSVWQTGSGTQTNMNINEVISYITGVHPNDEVNMGQSSNDTFPSAMHISAYLRTHKKLIPALKNMEDILHKLSQKNKDIIKIGRTHLQDATPLTLGQEISGWEEMIKKSISMIEKSMDDLRYLALGGTAVGTGLNTDQNFGNMAAKEISSLTGYDFQSAENKFHSLTSKDSIVFFHGALKALAANLMKIANDVRLLASGPRSGIGEIIIPQNEPGSSIMPGKVNPTQCEALTMVAVQVMGNDATVGFAASQGNFELNVFMPVIIYNTLQSIELLSDSVMSFTDNCLVGIEPELKNIEKHLNDSLMLITCLTPVIGYDKAASIAKSAYENGSTLKEEVVKGDYLSEDEFDNLVKPEKMVK